MPAITPKVSAKLADDVYELVNSKQSLDDNFDYLKIEHVDFP